MIFERTQINGLNGKDPKSCKNNKGEGIGMKRRTLALSILTVVCCLGLIVGATLALFNSSSKVDISVTSGDVNVSATITNYTTYSKGEETEKGTFENGGTATVDGGSVVLDRISPMDKIVLEIAVSNKSNIAYQYRMKLGTELEKTLYDQLLVGLSENGTEYTYYSSYVTAWQKGTEQTESTLYLSVELPEYVKSAWQGKECTFALTLEAVQGNAAVTDEAEASLVYIVETQDELDEAIATMKDYDTVVLGGGEWAQATIAFEDVKTINVRGYKVGVLTVNAPAGTVHYYNDAGTVIGEAIAENSLHVYGEIDSLQLKQGRTVVEAGAAIASMSVEPENAQEAKIEIKSESNVERIKTNPADDGKAIIIVDADATVPALNVSGTGETALDNNGTIEDTQVDDSATLTEGAVTEESFLTKLAAGGEIKLAADVTIEGQNVKVPEGITASVDLGGNTLTVNSNSGFLNYGTITALENGSIVGGNYYGIVNYGTIGTLNVNVRALGSSSMAAIYNYGVIDEIAGGEYLGHSGGVYVSPITGSVGLYNSTDGVVKLISGGYFQGSSVSFRNYNKNGIESVTGGFFDCPYMDANGKTFCDAGTISNLYYNYKPLSVTGGTFYNLGTQFNNVLGENYIAVQGDLCKMTSYKSYTEDRLWVDNEEGKAYYYYNVVAEWDQYPAWDGSIDTSWYNDTDAQFTLTDGADLAGLARLVNLGTTFKNKTVAMGANINLNNVDWTPIGRNATGFQFEGTFDGKDYTIYNLKISGGLINYSSNCYKGLFGSCTGSAKLQNFTLMNVDVKGSLNVAAVLGGSGGAEAAITNVHVTGSVKVYGWWYVGGILGKGYSQISGCSVIGDSPETSYVKLGIYNDGSGDSAGYVGGIVGFMGEGNQKITDCTIKNLLVQGNDNGVGGVSGILHYGNTISGCTLENVVVWQTGAPDAGTGRIYCGAFAGTYLDNGGKNCPTLENCTFNGEMYSGVEKNDILEANRYVGSLWYGSEPPATVNITNCTIVMPE